MLDIKFIRENPDIVKENIRKKFQEEKLPLVDEVIALDAQRRAAIAEVEQLKADRNRLSKANGPLSGKLKKCADEGEKAAIQKEIDANNAAVKADDARRTELDALQALRLLYDLQQQFSARNYEACEQSIAAMEEGALAQYLPREAGDGVTAPAQRYQQLKDAVEQR